MDKGKNVFLFGCALSSVLAASAQQKPNIIVIISDDMGYSDIGCYGGIIKTPNLDRLAKGGLQYMQFYNTARSCPSRASLMTGLHPHQAGIGHMSDKDRGEDGYRGDLNNHCVTLAQVMKTGGYENYAVGKWHLSRHMKQDGTRHNWPLQRGFDHFYGTLAGGGSYYDPFTLCRGNEFVTAAKDPEYHSEEFYYTNAITDNAMAFLSGHEQQSPEKPFFMYLAYTAAHWPMQVPEEEVTPYKGKFDKGWDELREQKYKKMVKAGIIRKEWGLSRDKSVKKWENVEDKAFETRCMEVYAGIISNLDKNIGRVIELLEKNGQLENTVILFLQDNGGCAEGVGRGEVTTVKVPKGKKLEPMAPDELQTVLIPYRTRDGRPMRMGTGVMPGGADTYISYGKAWAYLSNVPFREYKHWVHEGGIATPLLVHWPAGIKSKGERRWIPGQLMDVMATCRELSGATYPETYNGEEIYPCEGKSLVSSFRRDEPEDTRYLFWEHEGNRAVRSGKWKLVYKTGEAGHRDIPLNAWELYEIDEDRTELNNVASKHPEKVAELAEQWRKFAARCHVNPWPGKE